eukprot:10694200-Alexandrium_andersonii.AAC.1
MRPEGPAADCIIKDMAGQLRELTSEVTDARRRRQWRGLAGERAPQARGRGQPGWMLRRAGGRAGP